MIVVSDTSPLNYLILIDLPHVLATLFDHILIPDAVLQELRSAAAPQPVKDWLDKIPDWLQSRVVSDIPADLRHLDRGERETIALAQSVGASMVLLDERRARQIARARGLPVSGTLGVLDLAAQRGLVDVSEALDRLERTTFRASPRLVRDIRRRHLAGNP